jgi:DNA-binding NarL/FixJ family response regulator
MSELSILLTEDDEAVARYLSSILVAFGHNVVAVASDGVQAVRLARELCPDLVIMDMDLPHMDGATAARKILEERSVPLIISTGRTDAAALESIRDLNIQAFLIKPFSGVQLKSAMAIAISQHKMQSQAQQTISQLNGALEAAQDNMGGGGGLTQERLQTLGLTRRESEVMMWVAQGKSNSDIATILESSPRTIAKHIEHVFGKLNVESRTAAVAEAHRMLEDRQ